MNEPAIASRRGTPGVGAMLRCFAFVGATGFGGVLPIAYHELVTRRRWLTSLEFTEILSICQILPGPNVVNFSVVFGMRMAGWMGALACVAGLLAGPMALVMALAALWSGFSDVPVVQDITRAVSAGAAGLVCAMAARIFWPIRRNPVALAVAAGVVVAIAIFAAPLLLVLVVAAPLSILLMTFWSSARVG